MSQTLTKYSAAILECSLQLIGGTITTATFTLVMLSAQNSSQGTKASHSAVLATAEVLGKLSMISLSGILVDLVGYQCYFGLCLFLALLAVPVLKVGITIQSKKSLWRFSISTVHGLEWGLEAETWISIIQYSLSLMHYFLREMRGCWAEYPHPSPWWICQFWLCAAAEREIFLEGLSTAGQGLSKSKINTVCIIIQRAYFDK